MAIKIKKEVELSKKELIQLLCRHFNLDENSAELILIEGTEGHFKDEYKVLKSIKIRSLENNNAD
ncbi:hypothetical protein [Empedobacter tilapiae]